MIRLSGLSIGAAFLLGACATLGPDYAPPQPATPDALTGLETLAPDLIAADPVEVDWWARFDDPTLDGLIVEAAEKNRDVTVALARLRAAQSLTRATRARGLPRFGLDASAQRLRSSETAEGFGPPPGVASTQNLFETALSASWEVDLFGRIARRVEAAEARRDAAQDDARGLLLIAQAETAAAYLELRSLQDQWRVARENEALAERTLELTDLLNENELAPEFDLVRARAEVSEAAARQEALIGAQRAVIARLAVLVGRRPDVLMDDLMVPQPHPVRLQSIPVGLPSDLLRRRPDVRAAERRLAAATADIGAEKADLFPSFSLTGGGGFQSADLDALFEDGSELWSLGGFLRWPIFDGGANRAEVAIAEAEAEAALAAYDAAVLTAFSDVEASLSIYVYAVRQLRSLEAARADRLRAYELAELRYRSGLDDLFATLEAQRRLTTLDAELAAARGDVLAATVGAYRALGGGWEEVLPEEGGSAG